MKHGFTINAKNNVAEILIYEDIGDGWLGGVSAKTFVQELDALGTLDEINVRINSDGGSVFDGVAIYNALVRNPATVNVHIDGLAASIASVVAMAGDVVNISKNAWIMIHDPWTVAGGGADDLRAQADLLDKIRAQLLDTYKTKTGLSENILDKMMSAETWLTSGDAKEQGFVDNITDDLAIAASHSVAKYKHAPAILLNAKKSDTLRTTNNGTGAGVVSKMRESLKARKL